MERVIVNLKDDKGTVQRRVSRDTADKLATDNQYASNILEQIRAAEDFQVNPQSISPVIQLPVLPTPQPPTFTQSHTPQPKVSSTPSHIQTKPTATFTRCSTPIPQPQVSTTPSHSQTQPAATVTRCPTPETNILSHSSPSDSLFPVSSSQPECHETQTEFQHNTTLLLLELTRTYQHLYNRNKISFYKKLEEAFSAKGYSFTNDKIRRKLGNMLATY
ncbi:uncharacterized protein LOC117254179 [Epinephelus lanceolatus]